MRIHVYRGDTLDTGVGVIVHQHVSKFSPLVVDVSKGRPIAFENIYLPVSRKKSFCIQVYAPAALKHWPAGVSRPVITVGPQPVITNRIALANGTTVSICFRIINLSMCFKILSLLV